ncbi:MAG: hypothetical protein AAFP19_13925 [Bacteroidota bacterium]
MGYLPLTWQDPEFSSTDFVQEREALSIRVKVFQSKNLSRSFFHRPISKMI